MRNLFAKLFSVFSHNKTVVSNSRKMIARSICLENLESRTALTVVPGAIFVGQVVGIDPPASVLVNSLEDGANAKLFAERAQVQLVAPIAVDASRPGSYSLTQSLTPRTIAAGTIVNSYYLHADVTGTPASFRHMIGTITFSQPVLGVALGSINLNGSDVLGMSKTAYPKSGREFDCGDSVHSDFISLSSDMKTIRFDLQVSPASDDFRIITGTPLPPTAPLNVVAIPGNGRVNLRWTAPASDGNSFVAGYSVQYSSNAGLTWNNASVPNSTRLFAAVPNLLNGTNYNFRISAINFAGTGAYSTVVSATPTQGLQTSINLSQYANARLQNIGFGAVDKLPEGNIQLGGVDFSIPVGGANIWSATYASGTGNRSLDIAVGAYGVKTVSTLINSQWGESGSGTLASITFIGSAGTQHTVNLDGNVHIRDYLWNQYTNNINGTTVSNVFTAGSGIGNKVRLDMQTFTLPAAFANQTLTTIRLTDSGANGTQRVFISGVTVS